MKITSTASPSTPPEPAKPRRGRPLFNNDQQVFLKRSLQGLKYNKQGPGEVYLPKNSKLTIIKPFERDYPDSFYVNYQDIWVGIVKAEDLSKKQVG